MKYLSVRYTEVKDNGQTIIVPLISQFALTRGDSACQVIAVPSLSCHQFPSPAAVLMTA